MNRSGPAPQPLRGMPGSMFQNQQTSSSSSRGTLGSSRLQNGKLVGNTSGWGGYMGGAPGMSQPRPSNTGGLSSFAQTIGGSSGQAPLDLSEFPSLSGAPQSQQGNSQSQAIWGNSSSRSSQPAPVGRPQGQGQSMQQSGQLPQQQRSGSHLDGQTSQFSQLRSSVDDYRYGDHGTSGQIARNSENSGDVNEFPPLSGLGTSDMSQIRRSDSGQGSRFGNSGSNTNTFGQFQGRSGLFGHEVHQDGSNPSDRLISPTGINSRATPMSRSPLEQDQDGLQRQDTNSRMSQSARDKSFGGQMPFRSSSGNEQSQRLQHQQENGFDQGIQQDGLSAESSNSQMTDTQRFGLDGLMATLRGGSGDQTSLALGMDLNTLGFDLNRADNSPLYPEWAGPFAEPTIRPIIPEFTLPAAYTVSNVPSLNGKIPSFSDETLFAIFYQCPRDQSQMDAAKELHSRDWRWHKKLRQWMMKAKDFGEPQQLQSGTEERGYYYFFDVHNWRRERKEFILNYDHLWIPQ